MARGLILEGVTGAGKTSTLAALGRCAARPPWLANARVIPEEETIGELMTEELRDPSLTDVQRCHRMWRIGDEIEAAGEGAGGILLERFHPTYYALIPDWSLYEAMDARLAARGFRMVLLTVPEERLRRRSLHREEVEGWGEGMIGYWGSEEAAMEAIVTSQARRIACAAWTRLPVLRIDTSGKDWDAYAARIAAYAAEAP